MGFRSDGHGTLEEDIPPRPEEAVKLGRLERVAEDEAVHGPGERASSDRGRRIADDCDGVVLSKRRRHSQGIVVVGGQARRPWHVGAESAPGRPPEAP